MNPDRVLRRWLLLVSLLSITTFAVSDANFALFVLAIPAVIAAWWVTEGKEPKPLPRAIINLALAGIVAFSALRAYALGFSVSLFSEFVILLIIAKMLDRRTTRDSTQVLTLSIFLAIGAILTSNSIETTALLVLLIPGLLYTATLVQLASADERAEHAGAAPVTQNAEARALGRRLRRVVLVSLLIAAPFSVASFILLPRKLGAQAFGNWGAPAIGRVVGFNEEISLGAGGLISQSAEPVMDVQLRDANGSVLGSFGEPIYLRGAVLDAYDPEVGLWTRAPGRRNIPRETSRGPAPVSGSPREWDTEQSVTIRNVGRSMSNLFSVGIPKRVATENGTAVLVTEATQELQVADHAGRLGYTVWSETTRKADDRREPPEDGEPVVEPDTGEATGGPSPSPQYQPSPAIASLAREALEVGGYETDADSTTQPSEIRTRISALISRLASGEYEYTLETVAAPPGTDPIEWFLTEGRIGNCEYFASGLAAMCLATNINARVITGYVATDYNENTGHYLVRANNAHAWTEVETAPGIWERYDPTPGADFERIHAPPTGLLAELTRIFDAIEFAWIRNIVGFTAESRNELLGGEGNPAARAEVALGEFSMRLSLARPRDALRALLAAATVGIGVMLLAAMAVWLANGGMLVILDRLQALGIARRWGTRDGSVDRVHARLVASIERLLREAGAPVPAWVPLAMHAERVAAPAFDSAEVGQVIDRLDRAKYGREPLSSEEAEEITGRIDAQFSAVRQALRAGRNA